MTREPAPPPPGLSRHDRLVRLAAAAPGLISFAGGLPDPALFPVRELGDALRSALSTQGESALQYGWPEGTEALRADVAKELLARGAKVPAEQIVITSGAQQAIAIALASIPRAKSVAVDPETYPGALDLFRSAGASLSELRGRARAYYVMPSVSNPRGQRMRDDDKRELIERALRYRGYIIEDDAYDGTWFSGEPSRPLLADWREHVFHVGTFSKTLCPGLRVGWLVPPPALARRTLRAKQQRDLQTNGLAQALLVEYLRSGKFEALKRRARARYRRKARALFASVTRLLPELRCEQPRGGFSMWLQSELAIDDERLLACAVELGVSFDPGRMFRASSGGPLALRLSFSAVPEADIDEGVSRIAQALERVRRKAPRTPFRALAG